MTKFSTIIVIHLGDGLPSIASEEFLLFAIKFDTVLVEFLKRLGGSSHHESKTCIINFIITELSCSTLALPFFSWLALNAKSFFLVKEEPSCGVMCMYIS